MQVRNLSVSQCTVAGVSPSTIQVVKAFRSLGRVCTLIRMVRKFNLFIPAGLQPSGKHSGYPVRMDNSVPMVPQNQSAQSLHIQPSMLAQVTLPSVCESFSVLAA